MKFSEYVGRRNGITEAEADVLGIQFPLVKGWLARHSALEVDKPTLSALRGKRYASRIRAKEKKKQKNKEKKRYTAQYLTTAKTTKENAAFLASTEFLDSFEWRRLRMEVLKEYGARCQCCGATKEDGIVINVDHIKPRKLFPELALDRTNLQILCHPCNHGKGNWDQTDWRHTG